MKRPRIEAADKTTQWTRTRNDEQQYHAAGAAHDPHYQTQQRVDRGDPDAGDLDEVNRDEHAPFNKTYGHHQ